MKKIYTVLFISTLLFVLSGCSSKEDKIEVSGIWNLVKVETITKSATIGTEKVDVYFQLNSDNTMSIYEKLGDDVLMYEHREGDWSLEGKVLSGHYTSNGKVYSSWNSSYDVERVGEQLILTTIDKFNESKVVEKGTYQLVQQIPEKVVKNSRLIER